jgi:hypothetical protein
VRVDRGVDRETESVENEDEDVSVEVRAIRADEALLDLTIAATDDRCMVPAWYNVPVFR